MPTPPQTLAQPQNALHLYRHLLREASYLPPVCRARIALRIHNRFRKSQRDRSPEKRLRRACHDLRYLRAANCGDMSRMRRVVMLAFGRIGWRRHELMAELRRPEQPDSSNMLEDRLRTTQPARDWLDRWDTAKILTFAKSQARHRLHNSPRPSISTNKLDPTIAVPPANAWGRPFSEKAARTKTRKWWKGLAHRILPPAPRGEWELLKQLATGQMGREWTMPTRRVAAKTDITATAAAVSEWNWEQYATQPIRLIERPRSRRLRVLSVPVHSIDDSPYEGQAIGIHRYTARFWRRLYAEIWQMTAVMEKRPGPGSGWAITWGGLTLSPMRPSAASLEFFKGVGMSGEVLHISHERKLVPSQGNVRVGKQTR